MKPIFKDMLVSLLTGACFAIGLVLVLLALEYIELADDDDDIDAWVEIPAEVSVVQDSIMPNQDRLTIVGEIRNDAPFAWRSVLVKANIFVDSSLVNRCFASVDSIDKKSEKSFEIVCDWTTGTDLPSGMRYTLQLSDGVREHD